MFQVYKPYIIYNVLLVVATLLILVSLAAVIVGYSVFNKRSNKIGVIAASFVVLFVSIVVISVSVSVNSTKQNNYYEDSIRDFYKLEVLNDSCISDAITEMDYNNISGKIYATFDGDSRVYEIYLIKDSSDMVSAYTRNDKGVYLPISKASISSKENNTSFDIVEDQQIEDVDTDPEEDQQ